MGATESDDGADDGARAERPVPLPRRVRSAAAAARDGELRTDAPVDEATLNRLLSGLREI